MRLLPLALCLVLLGGCDNRCRSSVDTTAVEESGDKITVNYTKKDGAIETFNRVTMDGVWGGHPDEYSDKTGTICEKLEYSHER